MVHRPAKVHCDGLAIKEFVTCIGRELHTSMNKREPLRYYFLFIRLNEKACRCEHSLFVSETLPISNHEGPVVNELYLHFRKYWPNKRQKSSDALSTTGQQGAHAGQEVPGEDSPAPCPEEEMDDVELAEALGVPMDCIDKMSPTKPLETADHVPEHQSGSGGGGALTHAEWRDQRIAELKFP